MLRKTISVLLALAMVSALTACAGGVPLKALPQARILHPRRLPAAPPRRRTRPMES